MNDSSMLDSFGRATAVASEHGQNSDNHTQIPPSSTPLESALSTAADVIRRALLEDLKEGILSREAVALELSRSVGRIVSLAMLDAYLAETKQNHRFPVELVPAWVYVMKSPRLLQALCGISGLSLATQEDRDFAELGRAALRQEKLAKKLWERI